MGLIDRDAYIPRALAALLTGVSEDAIGKWHARGWQAPDPQRPGKFIRRRLRTKPGKGRHLRFNVGDIIDANTDTAANPNSRRPQLAAA